MQCFGNGRFKLQGESVSFRMTKPVQHRRQFSTSDQMSHSHADQCVLLQLPLPLLSVLLKQQSLYEVVNSLFLSISSQFFKPLLCDPMSYLTRDSVQKGLIEWGFSDTACDSCCENVFDMQINQNLGSSVRTSRRFHFLQFQALSSSLDIQTLQWLQLSKYLSL